MKLREIRFKPLVVVSKPAHSPNFALSAETVTPKARELYHRTTALPTPNFQE